jgi:N-methylhydantoinase A/acetophenone carboxylase
MAIEEKIARPLGIDVVEAASRIRRIIDAYMGQEVFKEVVLKGHDPRDLALFACGGAGPAHACSIAPHLGVSRVIVPSHSSVSGAFGASTVNIQQVWEKSRTLKIFKWTTQSYADDVDQFNGVVGELADLARRDLRLEGFSDEQIRFRLELDMRYGMQFNLTKIVSPRLQVSSPLDFKAICDTFSAQYASIYSPEATFPQGGINVECFYLTAYVETRAAETVPVKAVAKEPPPQSRGASRRAYWSSLQDVKETPVFIFESLAPGSSMSGPAIIEARDTTYVVEPGWRFTLDGYYNGVLELI